LAFDRHAGRLVALAEAVVGSVQTWTFDVCLNAWTRMKPDREPPPGTGDLVYDVDSDVTITLDGDGWVWAYDAVADTWVVKGAGGPTALVRPHLFYDPISGRVVALGDDGDEESLGLALWSYDVETDAWTRIPPAIPLAIGPHYEFFAYDASVDRIVAYAKTWEAAGTWDRRFETRTWLFDIRTGTWSATGSVTPSEFSAGMWGLEPAIAYDEAAERTVMLGQGHSAAYDASADRWEILYESGASAGEPVTCGPRPECRQMPRMIYDPVNERLLVYGGSYYAGCTWETPDDVWAFDPASLTWTLVLPPTPAPSPLMDLTGSGPSASAGLDRSRWIRAARVTLHGGPFFTRVPGVADQPWSSTPPAPAASVADGFLLPECQLWTEGTVWWEEVTSDPASRAWIEISLTGTFVLDSAVVQADVNDAYRLSYRDPETAEWTTLWDVPLGEAGGLATRPRQGDGSIRQPLASPVVTDALRFEATSGDAQYSVSEIAVFGRPAP
jgi:hypothetical protein